MPLVDILNKWLSENFDNIATELLRPFVRLRVKNFERSLGKADRHRANFCLFIYLKF